MGYVRPERAKRPANRPKWPLQSLRRPVCAIRFFEIHDPGAFDEHFFNGLLGERSMSVMSELKFYLMHFMPYPDIAPNMPNGQWVDIPNTRFDAKVGHKLYQEYLDELVLGDELGFDGLVVNEHHATFY